MNPQLVIEIVGLAVSLVANPKGETATDTLLQIVQKGALAYAQQTGQPLNPDLLKVEEPI